MAARLEGLCRGQGLAYLAFSGAPSVADVRASAITAAGRAVPCAVYDLSRHTQGQDLVVVAIPMLEVDVAVVLADSRTQEVLARATYRPLASKLQSRLLTARRPALASALRGIECRQGAGTPVVRLTEVWPAERGSGMCVWRVLATLPGDNGTSPLSIELADGQGNVAEAEVFVLEDHLTPAGRIATISLRVPLGQRGLVVSVRGSSTGSSTGSGAGGASGRAAGNGTGSGTGSGSAVDSGTGSGSGTVAAGGFAYGYPGIVADMLAHSSWLVTGGAAAKDYPAWFEAHRAHPAAACPIACPIGTRYQMDKTQMDTYQTPSWPVADAVSREANKISIVVPVFCTPRAYLEECVSSVLAQTHTNWELVLVNASGDEPCPDVDEVLAIVSSDPRVRVVTTENRSISENTNVGIAAATGDYVAFLDHDDVLEPDALACFANVIVRHPNTDLLYSDEDRLEETSAARSAAPSAARGAAPSAARSAAPSAARGAAPSAASRVLVTSPAFKCGPNLTKLRAHNYVTHLLMVSRRVLELTERSGADVAGAQDYDLTLKAFEVARRIAHIPRVLYHCRVSAGSTAGGADKKPFAHEAGRLALTRHLERVGIAAEVVSGPLACTYRVVPKLPDPVPKVSIVIPNRDHADLLRACVGSILARSTYPSYEVVVVENGSLEQATFALYEDLVASDKRVRVVSWSDGDLACGLPSENGFNYSAVINFGVRHTTGEVLVLLNNDTDVVEPAWLEALVGTLADPRVGVVGAKLLFPDGLVQHAGMIANDNGDFAHVNRNLASDELGYAFSAGLPSEVSMVTGACQMVSREVFDEVGGYDEHLAVGFNDGDFCLRVGELGRKVVFQPAAVLHHREFASRGREADDKRLRARLLKEKAYIVSRHPAFFAAGDPTVNPNLDRMSDWWALRW